MYLAVSTAVVKSVWRCDELPKQPALSESCTENILYTEACIFTPIHQHLSVRVRNCLVGVLHYQSLLCLSIFILQCTVKSSHVLLDAGFSLNCMARVEKKLERRQTVWMACKVQPMILVGKPKSWHAKNLLSEGQTNELCASLNGYHRHDLLFFL